MKSFLRLLHVAFAIALSGSAGLRAGQVPATIHAVNEAVELRFNTVNGKYYEIHDSANLAGWAPVETAIEGNGAEVVRTYPINGVPKRFFQVHSVTVPAGLVPIPAGSFIMGNSFAGDDNTEHQVTLSGFYIARNLVTKAEWDTVWSWAMGNGYSDMATGSGKADNHPVQTVSWWDCIKYCNARSQQEGLTPVYTVGGMVMKTGTTVPTVDWNANGYRLPTEAEWEKAGRGGLNGKRFPWGDTISHTQANYFGSDIDVYDLSLEKDYHPYYAVNGEPYTSPVGSFAANGYGLNDMAGNVWQWCWDWYGAYDAGSPVDPRGASSGLYRVIRGGSWKDPASNCRVAFRNSTSPGNTDYTFGFRIVRNSLR
jgi:formylglycine-generating enzyme required for sulfatase activity